MDKDHKKDQTTDPKGSANSSNEASESLAPPNLLTSMTELTDSASQVGETLTPSKKTLKEL